MELNVGRSILPATTMLFQFAYRHIYKASCIAVHKNRCSIMEGSWVYCRVYTRVYPWVTDYICTYNIHVYIYICHGSATSYWFSCFLVCPMRFTMISRLVTFAVFRWMMWLSCVSTHAFTVTAKPQPNKPNNQRHQSARFANSCKTQWKTKKKQKLCIECLAWASRSTRAALVLLVSGI